MQRQALFTVSAKRSEYLGFAKTLHTAGWKILATGGTAKFLKDGGVEVTDIADIVGPPMFGHLVVSLSREISAMALGNPDNPEHAAEFERLKLAPIDLACVDLYPLEAALEDGNEKFETLREKIDIGGRTLLTEAAKGNRFVISSVDQIEKFQELIVDEKADAAEVQQAKYRMAAAAEMVAFHHSRAARSVYRKQVPKKDRQDSF